MAPGEIFLVFVVAAIVLVAVFVMFFASRESFDAHCRQDAIDHANRQMTLLMAIRDRPEYHEPLDFAADTYSFIQRESGVAKLDDLILANDAIRMKLIDEPECDIGEIEAELGAIDAIAATRKSERETVYVAPL